MPRGKRTKQSTNLSDSGPAKRSQAGDKGRYSQYREGSLILIHYQQPVETTTTNRQFDVTTTTNNLGHSNNTRRQATQWSANECKVNPTTNHGGTPNRSTAKSTQTAMTEKTQEMRTLVSIFRTSYWLHRTVIHIAT